MESNRLGIKRACITAVLSLLMGGIAVGSLFAASITSREVYNAAYDYIVNETGYLPEDIILEFRSPFPAIEVPDDREVELSLSGEIGPDAVGRLPLKAQIFVDMEGNIMMIAFPGVVMGR